MILHGRGWQQRCDEEEAVDVALKNWDLIHPNIGKPRKNGLQFQPENARLILP